MIISEALRQGTRLIQSTGSDEARLEAELLLMHALKTDRVHLYERLQDELPARSGDYFQRLLDRRLLHEPTPYIVGHKEFFGMEFEVTRSALIPRPETETLVELAIDFARDRYADNRFTAVDVGTGSGVIAVALACKLPKARVIATDVSKRALALARRNARRHGVASRIEFFEGATLLPVEGRADIIAANLPYVTTADWLATPPEIHEWEPRRALDGGVDGLRHIRHLFRQAPEKLARNGALFAEIGDRQAASARTLAEEAFPEAEVDVRPDLAGRDRVICVYA
ncbi:MAG: peptide chain release factor N(5)-glutamine methyltransferase [Chloroflexi bacterium]|nr:peptide chain release factor N(5)-glutamine methyltransferase [Chloroflexota bacterium]